MQKKFRVFLDTSALIAGLNSPTGDAGIIIASCFTGRVVPIISPQVIEEMADNIPKKFPKLAAPWASFLLTPPEIAPPPSLAAVKKAYATLPTNDAPILACAIKAQPDVLVTWNTRHFLRKAVVKATDFPILKPSEFLRQFLT